MNKIQIWSDVWCMFEVGTPTRKKFFTQFYRQIFNYMHFCFNKTNPQKRISLKLKKSKKKKNLFENRKNPVESSFALNRFDRAKIIKIIDNQSFRFNVELNLFEKCCVLKRKTLNINWISIFWGFFQDFRQKNRKKYVFASSR